MLTPALRANLGKRAGVDFIETNGATGLAGAPVLAAAAAMPLASQNSQSHRTVREHSQGQAFTLYQDLEAAIGL